MKLNNIYLNTFAFCVNVIEFKFKPFNYVQTNEWC